MKPKYHIIINNILTGVAIFLFILTTFEFIIKAINGQIVMGLFLNIFLFAGLVCLGIGIRRKMKK